MMAMRYLLAAGMFAVVAAGAFAQVGMDDCTACQYRTKMNGAMAERGITEDFKLIKNGVVLLMFGTSAEDPKWLKSQFAEFDKVVRAPDAKFCDMCMAFVNFSKNSKTTEEFVPTKTGAVYLLTSTDTKAVETFHKALKPMMEQMEGGGMEHGGANTAEVKTAGYLAKGDGTKTCPVTGDTVNKNVSAVINGRTVYFCCAGCIAKVKADPNAYLK